MKKYIVGIALIAVGAMLGQVAEWPVAWAQAPASPVVDAQIALEKVRNEIAQYNDLLDSGYTAIAQADSGFGGMTAKWGALKTAVDTNAAEAGTNAWDAMKLILDQYVTEFQAGKTAAAAQKAALDAL